MNAKLNNDSGLRVFISSTFEDLRAYREAAKEAALNAEMLPRMQEYFNAAGDRPPLDRCLAEVAACHLTVVLVAHRYGWIPADQPAGQARSITRLEVDRAIAGGQEVLAFLVDDKQDWPEDLREESQLVAAIRAGKATAEQLQAVQENVERLKAFKDWLSGRGIRSTFTTPEHLRRVVAEALADWRKRNLAPEAAVIRLAPSDPTRYLEALREQTSHIDIRGLQVGTGRVHRFPIEDLFISLTTTALPARRGSPDPAETPDRQVSSSDGRPASVRRGSPDPAETPDRQVSSSDGRPASVRRGSPDPAETPDRQVSSSDGRPAVETVARSGDRPQPAPDRPQPNPDRPQAADDRTPLERATLPLHTALQHDCLMVVGDPGAGKTTFVRRVAYALCQTRLGQSPDAAQTRLGVADRTFPILIRLSELAQHIHRCRSQAGAPATQNAPAWLPHFLAAVSGDSSWGLDEAFFRRQLQGGLCTVLLDGLDEAPDRIAREQLCTLIVQAATGAYRDCRWVVTSRPSAYTGASVLSEFAHAEIDPLSDEATETFLSRWCGALYADSPDSAGRHLAELLDALRARPDIRRMARNPVMAAKQAVPVWGHRCRVPVRLLPQRSRQRCLAATGAGRRTGGTSWASVLPQFIPVELQ